MADDIDSSDNNVIRLSPTDPLTRFEEMWYQIFLWGLFSSILVHVVACSIACSRMRRHKIGRFIPLAVIISGVLAPLTGGVVTSAVIAGVYKASGFAMKPLYALVWGVGQTIVMIFISFTRILGTL